jgi:hypothetical protein
MSRKPVRFGLLIVGLLISAALALRAVNNEASLGRAYRESAAHNLAAGQALEALPDLRASLYAYVAPGQGVPFWSRRSEQLLDSLRQNLVTLDAAAAPSGVSLAETLDAVDQLAAAERRSREYARRGETLLAGDIVFTEVRDVLAEATDQIYTARTRIAATYDRRVSALRREQAMIGAAGVITWIAIALLLVTPTKAEPAKDPNAWRDELAQTIKKPVPKEPERTKPLEPLERLEPLEPLRPAEPSVSLRSVQTVSEICADLSSLGDTGALAGALERAATVLGASGVIVWIASNDGNSLAPVASHGFDQKLVTRIGRIPRESANLTAAAFRENVPRVSAATSTAPAALAVSLCGPSGPVGVLSVELKPDVPADDSRVALATIFAAQLATLANPIPSAPVAPVAPVAPAKVEQSKSAAL